MFSPLNFAHVPFSVSPNVTLEMAVIENEGKAFFKVLCKAKGGRPHPSNTWIKPKSADKLCSAHLMNFESLSSSHCFPLDVYEGENITCIFGYPHLSAIEKTITLPKYCEYMYNYLLCLKSPHRKWSLMHALKELRMYIYSLLLLLHLIFQISPLFS